MKTRLVIGILVLLLPSILTLELTKGQAQIDLPIYNLHTNYATTEASLNDWTMFRHDAQHTGVAKGPAPIDGIQILWKYKTRASSPFWRPPSSPAIVGNTVFVGFDSHVYALDATTGELMWEFETGAWVESSPAVYQGKVYVGSWDGYVYCLNASNGNLIWKYLAGNYIISPPTVVNGKVFIGSNFDSYLYSLNASNGQLIWRYHASDWGVESSPAVSAGIVVAGSIGTTENRIFALNETNGEVLWSYQTTYNIHSSPAIVNGTVFIGGAGNGPGPILTLDLFTGIELWSYSTSAFFPASPAVKNGRLFIPSLDGNVYSLNITNGELLWTYREGNIAGGLSPAVVDGTVIIGGNDGYLYWLNESDGSLVYKFEVGSPIVSSPSVSNGIVYFSTNDGYIYAVGSIIKIEIDRAFVSNIRVDVGSSQTIGFHAKWVNNSSDIVGASISVNGTEYVTNGTGWISFNYNSSSVGKKTWVITGVNASGATSYRQTVENPSIIWDRVIVTLENNRVNVGNEVIISYQAFYEYDGEAFSGSIMLNDTVFTQDILGKRGYQAIGIIDEKYQLTQFTSNEAYVIFDRIKASYQIETLSPGTLKLIVNVQYEYDNAPVVDATVKVNDVIGENLGNGIYEVDLPLWIPYQSIDIEIEKIAFTPMKYNITVYSLGNIALWAFVSFSTISAMAFSRAKWIHKRKLRHLRDLVENRKIMSIEEVAKVMNTKTENAEKLLHELTKRKMVEGFFTSDGKAFIVEEKLKEEILRSYDEKD